MVTVSDLHRDKLRRLRVLQRLAQVYPNPMGELALLDTLRTDPELNPTLEHVRAALNYLADYGLVNTITAPGADWLAGAINTNGLAWLKTPSDLGLEIYSPGELPEPANPNHRGRVSSVEVLPTEVKAWLDQELVRLGFRDYDGLAQSLKEQGHEISRSALGRYGKNFKEEQKALKQSIEMAKAFAEVVGDDGAAMNQTLTALAQQELMTIVREGRYDDDDIKLPALVQSIAQLNRSDVNTRKFQIEQAARRKALAEAADRVESAANERGLSAEDALFWREKVLMGM